MRSDHCTTLRRMLITSNSLNLATGELTPKGSAWETKECNVPLFGHDKDVGVCRSCQNEWDHPRNYRVQPDGITPVDPTFKPEEESR